MDKEEFAQPDADNFEFISRRDAQFNSITSDSCSSTDSGIPLSNAEKALADRVRHLQQENKEIRSAIENYQKALQLCQESLNNVIDREGEILAVAQKKYTQAKSKVEKQNEKISSLEKQLEEEKNKHSNLGKATPDEKQQQSQNDSEKLEVPKKNTFEEKASGLLQFVGTLSGLTPNERKTSMSPDLLQDLINLSVEMEKYIKPLFESVSATGKNALEDELKFVKQQLKLEEKRRAELEARYDELDGRTEFKKRGEADLQEVQEEMKLLHQDMEKMDMVRAGCVSHDSQTTDESLSLNLPGQQQSVNNSLILKLKSEIQELTGKNEKLGSQLVRYEKKSNDQIDKHLADKEALEKERDECFADKEALEKERDECFAENEALKKQRDECFAENEALEKERDELKAKFDEKPDESELQKALEEYDKIKEELEEQKVKYNAMEKELSQRISTKEEEKTELFEELATKEVNETQLKAQVSNICREVDEKELQCEDLNERLNLSKIEHEKMISALEEMRKELNAVYAQNEKFLTERKNASEIELVELQSKIDNLTAQLLSAEEMLEHKEADLRELRDRQKGLTSELEAVPLLKQQLDVYQADFNVERQTRQKVEDDNRKLRDEVAKLHADNERLAEEANDPTGSRLAEMQRRHGCRSMQAGGGNDNPWSGFYDQFLAPRGPAVARNSPNQPPHDSDMNRQVSGGRCPKCDRVFPDLDSLQTHVVGCLESESTGSVGGKICPKCQGSFPDLDTLQIHVMECLDN